MQNKDTAQVFDSGGNMGRDAVVQNPLKLRGHLTKTQFAPGLADIIDCGGGAALAQAPPRS